MILFGIPSEICWEQTNGALFLNFGPKKFWRPKCVKKSNFLEKILDKINKKFLERKQKSQKRAPLVCSHWLVGDICKTLGCCYENCGTSIVL